MDLLSEVRRLLEIEKREKIASTALDTMEQRLHIYKYTYDECEIGGVGYILASDDKDAKSKMPYYKDQSFRCGLYYIMSMDNLKDVLCHKETQVFFEDMDSEYGYDTFENRIEKE